MRAKAGMTISELSNSTKRLLVDAVAPGAQTESACAGALGIQLAGHAYYFGELYEKPTIGDDVRPIEAEDIKRANKLMYATAGLGLGVAAVVGLLRKR